MIGYSFKTLLSCFYVQSILDWQLLFDNLSFAMFKNDIYNKWNKIITFWKNLQKIL